MSFRLKEALRLKTEAAYLRAAGALGEMKGRNPQMKYVAALQRRRW